MAPATPAIRPVVFCGPSGVGKGTLIEMLMERFPKDQFGFSVSHTTRGPREGEVDGVHYNFTTVEDIKKEIAKGKFIEYAEVHGRYYGTSFAAVETVQSSGKVCILDIDVQGVQNVKKSKLKPHYIFVAPPSMKELERRLRGRGTEKEADIKRRLGNAAKEMEYGNAKGNFDLLLVNDNLTKSFAKLVAQMKKWYPTLKEFVKSKPVVICGPTGVDKATLVNMLMTRFPDQQFGLAISHTTRKPATGEEEGIDHYFVTEEAMKADIQAGKFIQLSEHNGTLSGIALSTVKTIKAAGKICILDTDVAAVKQIKKVSLDPNTMFVAPLSMDVLEASLRATGNRSDAQVKSLLSTASSDLEYGQVAGNFDRIFIMADMGATFEDMVYALKEWYPHLNEVAPDDPEKSCTCTIS
uniref:guanylate kinase n=1 Tax=Cyclophora tenuis TaxID=216820 RepID=A0A7S1GQ70_CYCTE